MNAEFIKWTKLMVPRGNFNITASVGTDLGEYDNEHMLVVECGPYLLIGEKDKNKDFLKKWGGE